jgi:hypothetical protein
MVGLRGASIERSVKFPENFIMAASLEGVKFLTHHLLRYGILYYVLYLTIQSIYRVTFHPLAKYPGPVSNDTKSFCDIECPS